MKNYNKKIIITAMFACLCCVATMIIKIPSPLEGYINLGDVIVLLSGWMLSPALGFCAAAIGSALADVFSGYMLYVPATFLIKGVMSVVSGYIFRTLSKKSLSIVSAVISGVIAEIIMISGYYVFEGFLYGFIPSLVNIPANAVQGVAGIVIGIPLLKIFQKTKLF